MTQNDFLYKSPAFTLTKNGVIQGQNRAIIHSAEHISSKYKSPSSDTYSRLVSFKFSINEKDNELPFGVDHQVIIGDQDVQSPLIRFGEMPTRITEKPDTYLPPNHAYTFRVDMSPVMKQFEEKGYYETYNGTRIAKSDFKGVYIAGSSEPLSWDFVGLGGKGLQLVHSDQDHIYTITLKMNPHDNNPEDAVHWKKSWDTSDKPTYHSEQPVVDALYNLSLEEAKRNIEPDSTLRTGAKWSGVWTRDISYSIFLAFAYHEPEIAKISLMKKVLRDRIIQDTGSGGAWPVSSDRTIWALAAWEIYKVTGDRDWLLKAYRIIKNTLDDDFLTLSSLSGLYKGESSFLDWREQTYPKWMDNADIFNSENLGTNAVHYQAHIILASMARILGQPNDEYLNTAERIKSAINKHLWMSDKGHYAQYRYGRINVVRSDRFEALGEALSVIFNIADDTQTKSIISQSPLTDFGASCIYPQIPGIPPYHNNAVWPFVQAYWNLAAAQAGNEKVLNHGLAAIYRAGALFSTNYENFVAQSGDFKGTEINSDRMLWSMAGNLAMVHRVFMGMNFEEDGIRFSPVIPKNYGGTKSLSGFKYRDAVLNIRVIGFGKNIKTFKINGIHTDTPFISATLSGKIDIEIEMDNTSFDHQSVNLTANHFTLPNPVVRREGDVLRWEHVSGSKEYHIYKNGILWQKITNNFAKISEVESAEYSVTAIDHLGYKSFMSEPVFVVLPKNIHIYPMEQFAQKSGLSYSGFTGDGFVEISNHLNEELNISIDVPENGNYIADFRYSNGSGPWNTDNKCGIRSLYHEDKYQGVFVFPQRGMDEWSDWGFSNPLPVFLKKGRNHFTLKFESWNNNMNVDVNRAILDSFRLMRVAD